VGRLAEALPAGVRDAEFERLIARIDTGPIHTANNVEIHTNGDAAFCSILGATESAKCEILLETYILKDGALGRQLMEREGRLFHPLWAHVLDHLIRDHRKILIVDRSVCFVGGMNVGNEYGSSRHARPACGATLTPASKVRRHGSWPRF
jgi:cardiolipin synthase